MMWRIVKIVLAVLSLVAILFLIAFFLSSLNASSVFAQTYAVVEPPSLPSPEFESSEPPPPTMSMDVYHSLPDYIKAEVKAMHRKAFDEERRPTVELVWRRTLTNEWTVIGRWKPYELTGFYDVRIKP
jgi:hypothetical protein